MFQELSPKIPFESTIPSSRSPRTSKIVKSEKAEEITNIKNTITALFKLIKSFGAPARI